jgi:DNA repair exonuclease SbcCD nuclease subunit
VKILLFSDLHAHPFKPYATILESGMNSRLADAIGCLEQVLAIARGEDVDLVLFGGDMFHVRRTINVTAFNAVYSEMAKFSLYKIPVAMIHGNHDQADRQGEEHSVHAFRAFCSVIDRPGWEILTGKSGAQYAVLGVPYTENIEHLRHVVSQPCPAAGVHRMFLGHLGIQGARVGADFVYVNPHDASVEDLALAEVDAGYLGHYHEHQQIGRFWYIGAPLQHTWGDKGQWRGCLVYDTDTGQHKQFALEAPRFVELTTEEIEEGGPVYTDDCYVRIVDDKPWDDEKRENMREILRSRSLEVVKPKNGHTASGVRVQMAPSMSYHDMMQTFVRSGVQRADDLDPSYLIQLGAEILEEVENE